MAGTDQVIMPQQGPDTAERGRDILPAGNSIPLGGIDPDAWRNLTDRALEPNGYHLPEWDLALHAAAPERNALAALAAWGRSSAGGNPLPQLNGVVPIVSFREAYRVPLPILVNADPFTSLGTPLIDRNAPVDAAAAILQGAREAGARALLFRNVAIRGDVMAAFSDALRQQGLSDRLLASHARAELDATRSAPDLLRSALGAKKLKELRRQRRRLGDRGDVSVTIARSPAEVARDLETFLTLEASGWKGRRGSALISRPEDARFIRRAAPALAATGCCEIILLRAGPQPVAAAIVLRHLDRAFYFKLGIDEAFAKYSPGAQLTLDLTRHLCEDPAIASADSTANAGHPMIKPIWRGRFLVGDILMPLYRNDPIIALGIGAYRAHTGTRAVLRRLRKWLTR